MLCMHSSLAVCNIGLCVCVFVCGWRSHAFPHAWNGFVWEVGGWGHVLCVVAMCACMFDIINSDTHTHTHARVHLHMHILHVCVRAFVNVIALKLYYKCVYANVHRAHHRHAVNSQIITLFYPLNTRSAECAHSKLPTNNAIFTHTRHRRGCESRYFIQHTRTSLQRRRVLTGFAHTLEQFR